MTRFRVRASTTRSSSQWPDASYAARSLPVNHDAAPHPSASDALRVLHIFRYFRPDFTGEGLYLEKLAHHLDRTNIQSDVAVECTRGPSAAKLKRVKSNDRIRQIRFFGMGSGEPRRFPSAIVLWLATHAFRYDIVHFHAFIDRLFLLHLLARASGCRIVQSSTLDDGLGSVLQGYRPLYRPLLRRLCWLIDVAIAISPKLHADNADVLPPERNVLIPQGVNLIQEREPVSRARWRARWGFQDDDVVLLFVGAMCARKDVAFLVENHAALASVHGRVKLLLVGPELEGGYVDALNLAVTASPCCDEIMVEGYLDDPSPAYLAADVFVFASREEGFGNVLIEAMSWGLPIVSRRLAGVTDYILDHNRTGFLFDTPGQYQVAVQTLIIDADRRQKMGQAAQAKVRDCFDLRPVASRYAEVYRNLAAVRRRPTRRA